MFLGNGGDLTDGSPANTFKVTITYFIDTLVP